MKPVKPGDLVVLTLDTGTPCYNPEYRLICLLPYLTEVMVICFLDMDGDDDYWLDVLSSRGVVRIPALLLRDCFVLK